MEDDVWRQVEAVGDLLAALTERLEKRLICRGEGRGRCLLYTSDAADE